MNLIPSFAIKNPILLQTSILIQHLVVCVVSIFWCFAAIFQMQNCSKACRILMTADPVPIVSTLGGKSWHACQKQRGKYNSQLFCTKRLHSLFFKLTRQFLCCKKSTATFHCHFYLQTKVLETCIHLTIISAVKLGMDWIFQLLSHWLWLPLSFVKSRLSQLTRCSPCRGWPMTSRRKTDIHYETQSGRSKTPSLLGRRKFPCKRKL